jgi:hypothetical protein
MAAYFLSTFIPCLAPRRYRRRTGEVGMDLECGSRSQTFLFINHLHYATSCRTGVAAFHIGKLRRLSCPLYAGSRAPPQQDLERLLTIAPVRTYQPPSSPISYDASTKASLSLNSIPTFPSIDFNRGYLLSFCLYCLLETQWLPTAPRQYGNGLSVLAQPGIISL